MSDPSTLSQTPELLKSLMDDANAHLPRVQNVTLAVNMARHSANGWTDAALPDDFAAIEKLLHISHEKLASRLDIPPELLPKAPDRNGVVEEWTGPVKKEA